MEDHIQQILSQYLSTVDNAFPEEWTRVEDNPAGVSIDTGSGHMGPSGEGEKWPTR